MSVVHQHQALYDQFRWLVPARFTIAEACCHRWALSGADARRIALYTEAVDGTREVFTYQRLYDVSSRLARALQRMDVRRGDRVAVILPPRAETVAAHLAILQLGAISVPLQAGSSSAWLEQVLHHCKAKVAMVDVATVNALIAVLPRCPALQQVIGVDVNDEHCIPWRSLLARQDPVHVSADIRASDPALLVFAPANDGMSNSRVADGADVYRPSTPGAKPPRRQARTRSSQPCHDRAVVLSHAALIGMLPGFVAAFDWFPGGNDVLWAGADWSGVDALLGGVLPTLYFGCSVVASAAGHVPDDLPMLLNRYRVTHALMQGACAASAMGAANVTSATQGRRIDAERGGSGSDDTAEPLPYLKSVVLVGAGFNHLDAAGAAVDGGGVEGAVARYRQRFGVTPNIVFSTPETGFIVGGSRYKWPHRAGSMGLAYPGHNVAVVNAEGRPVEPGETGAIALHDTDAQGHADPAMFSGYWQANGDIICPLVNGWFRTAQAGRADDDGYFWPVHVNPHALQPPSSLSAARDTALGHASEVALRNNERQHPSSLTPTPVR